MSQTLSEMQRLTRPDWPTSAGDTMFGNSRCLDRRTGRDAAGQRHWPAG
jgi:hypothetical protein